MKIKNDNNIQPTKLPLKINFENSETKDSNILKSTKNELVKILNLNSEEQIIEKLRIYTTTMGIPYYGIFKLFKRNKKDFLFKENKIPSEVKSFKRGDFATIYGENYIIAPLLGESKNVFFYIYFSRNKVDEELIDRLRAVLKFLYFYKEKNGASFEEPGLKRNDRPKKDFIVVSKEMKEVVRKAIRFAATGKHILITGETGTGKEIIADLIREESPRRNFPTETTNLSALDSDVIDSELFGHKKGSYTGAIADHVGVFERNNGGIIFLDEVSLLPLRVQEKLLRTVEYGDIYPLGDKPKKVDVQIIFATNEDLEQLVKKGKFRKDLYYRISALKIKIPPLRERKDDIIPICEYYLKLFLISFNKEYRGMNDDVKEMLINYPWEGNVRELRNHMLLIATNMEEEKPVEIRNLPEAILKYFSEINTERFDDKKIEILKKELERKEFEMIKKALDITHGNKTRAAKILGMSRSGFFKKYKQFFGES